MNDDACVRAETGDKEGKKFERNGAKIILAVELQHMQRMYSAVFRKMC